MRNVSNQRYRENQINIENFGGARKAADGNTAARCMLEK
jgi:hypothetical protein